MSFQASRGGEKPRMLPKGSDIFISMGFNVRMKKAGMYELSDRRDAIARRVELPEWLSKEIEGRDPLEAVMRAKYPKEDIGESRGHIFMRPPRDLFSSPAVGLDMEVYDQLFDDPRIETVKFYVYSTGYRLVAIWSINADLFVDKARTIRTKPQFMPQMMVPLSLLTALAIPNSH